MALPNLPVQGQNPWYTPRTNWDVAVKTELEGRLSQTTMDANYAATNRTKRVFRPEEYGAVGNGTNNDTTAMVNCYNAARAVRGSVVLAYNKIYVVGSTLNPTGTRTDGDGATIRMLGGVTANFNIFQPSGAFAMSNLTIDLNKANTTDPAATTTGAAIYAFSAAGWSDSIVISDVTVINGHQAGIRIGATAPATDAINSVPGAANLTNVRVSGTKYGIWIQGIAGVKILNPTISGTGLDGVFDYLTRDTQVIGGSVTSAGNHGVITQYSLRFSCIGVQVTGAGFNGICAGGGSTTIVEARGFVFSNNRISGCVASGISLDTTKTGAAGVTVPCEATVSGNISTDNTIHGIYLHNARYVTVSDNLCRRNGNGGISLDSLQLSISNNNLTNNAYGLKFLGNTGTYGSHSMGRNTVADNTTSNYYFDAVGALNTALDLVGSGSPETVMTAPVGSRFMRLDGGANTTFYVKESGSGNTGWVAK